VRLLVLFAALALALGVAAPAFAATPRTTLPDVEDEVMCTQCGTALNISEAPSADRQRAFIRTLIAQGRSQGRDQTGARGGVRAARAGRSLARRV
jgi:hypothetical protein